MTEETMLTARENEEEAAAPDCREMHGAARVDKDADSRRALFLEGFHDGIPIALGYFVVSFTLGIAAKAAGLSPFQGFLASFFNNASAGEYAAFTLIAAKASYLELAVMTLVANARYMLMSCVVSQKFAPGTPLYHRLLVGFDITDEIFGITIARPGRLAPFYNYGAMSVALPGWAVGTALGVIAGNLLSPRLVSALSVALLGWLLWVGRPAARAGRGGGHRNACGRRCVFSLPSFVSPFFLRKRADTHNVELIITDLVEGNNCPRFLNSQKIYRPFHLAFL